MRVLKKFKRYEKMSRNLATKIKVGGLSGNLLMVPV